MVGSVSTAAALCKRAPSTPNWQLGQLGEGLRLFAEVVVFRCLSDNSCSRYVLRHIMCSCDCMWKTGVHAVAIDSLSDSPSRDCSDR
jgi:hypothetical protein